MKIPSVNKLKAAKAGMTVGETQMIYLIMCAAMAGWNGGAAHRMNMAESKHCCSYLYWLGFWMGAIGIEIYRANRAVRKTDEYARVQNAIKYLRERAARSGNER